MMACFYSTCQALSCNVAQCGAVMLDVLSYWNACENTRVCQHNSLDHVFDNGVGLVDDLLHCETLGRCGNKRGGNTMNRHSFASHHTTPHHTTPATIINITMPSMVQCTLVVAMMLMVLSSTIATEPMRLRITRQVLQQPIKHVLSVNNDANNNHHATASAAERGSGIGVGRLVVGGQRVAYFVPVAIGTPVTNRVHVVLDTGSGNLAVNGPLCANCPGTQLNNSPNNDTSPSSSTTTR
jgi:hypothetical protein